MRPHIPPLFVFLVSKRSLLRFWGCLVWHLWKGEAKHPGPWDGSIGVEVFNVGGWLTHGDLALETEVDIFWLLLSIGLCLLGFVVSGVGFA